MKKNILSMLAICFAVITVMAQTTPSKPTFSKAEVEAIQKVLGKDFTAVLGPAGQLAIVAPKNVSSIKMNNLGGFTGSVPSAANAVVAGYEKFWVYKQSGKSALTGVLGSQRFQQLSDLLSVKGVIIN